MSDTGQDGVEMNSSDKESDVDQTNVSAIFYSPSCCTKTRMAYFLLPHKDDVFEENDSLLKYFQWIIWYSLLYQAEYLFIYIFIVLWWK